ncbi:hypothetical protein MTBBW1_2620013 [Desulfamplus magnetovallimortis]|uniref:Uncharacterized protein n=1 Tax=Desulfamplus magnetovallimortis TaxID=1246637 RepID=A0A1W1HEY5_9BACT|nr:hypothetical protein [Desulfamplus magnetovallimortis]SLM31049.1 hypothetical protein MTBBW1_2620013 [Desulfamplus magnetovallimortis]
MRLEIFQNENESVLTAVIEAFLDEKKDDADLQGKQLYVESFQTVRVSGACYRASLLWEIR